MRFHAVSMFPNGNTTTKKRFQMETRKHDGNVYKLL